MQAVKTSFPSNEKGNIFDVNICCIHGVPGWLLIFISTALNRTCPTFSPLLQSRSLSWLCNLCVHRTVLMNDLMGQNYTQMVFCLALFLTQNDSLGSVTIHFLTSPFSTLACYPLVLNHQPFHILLRGDFCSDHFENVSFCLFRPLSSCQTIVSSSVLRIHSWRMVSYLGLSGNGSLLLVLISVWNVDLVDVWNIFLFKHMCWFILIVDSFYICLTGVE